MTWSRVQANSSACLTCSVQAPSGAQDEWQGCCDRRMWRLWQVCLLLAACRHPLMHQVNNISLPDVGRGQVWLFCLQSAGMQRGLVLCQFCLCCNSCRHALVGKR